MLGWKNQIELKANFCWNIFSNLLLICIKFAFHSVLLLYVKRPIICYRQHQHQHQDKPHPLAPHSAHTNTPTIISSRVDILTICMRIFQLNLILWQIFLKLLLLKCIFFSVVVGGPPSLGFLRLSAAYLQLRSIPLALPSCCWPCNFIVVWVSLSTNTSTLKGNNYKIPQ